METIIAESLAIALSAAVHVFFWVTLVFVILERSGTQTGGGWDVDQLPQAQDPDARLSDVVASLALLAVTAAAVLWDGTRGVVHVRGETLSFLHPQLWPWWMAALFILFALEALIAVTVWIRRGWTGPLAAVNTLAALLVVSWTLTLLGRGLLVNPAFTEAVLLDNGVGADVVRILGVLLGVGVTAIAGWDAASGWVKARRSTGPAR